MEIIALTSWTAALLVVITVVFRYLFNKNG
jgi:TRAP-type C4-dicarboxylate transport system permease small subunit